MSKEELLKAVVVIGLIVLVACSTVQAAGLGISPPEFTITDAIRGGEYESTITAQNLAEEDADFEITTTGAGSEWLTFYRAEDPLTSLETYLFSWDKVPGEDSERLLLSLNDVLNIGWAEGAEISKSEDNKTISILKEGHTAEITLDVQNLTATLTTTGGRNQNLKVKAENGKLNIYVTTIPIKGTYLFTWNEVPGNDSERLLKYLWDDLALGWARNAEIQKSEDNKTIRIFSGVNWAEITLDEHNEKVTLATSDGRTITLYVKEKEDGTLKICKGASIQRILVKITIAEDAQNKVYNSTFYIKGIPPETVVGAGAAAHGVVRGRVDASIAVTGIQILKGAVKSISTANTEIGYPLRIIVEFQNEGNVVATPIVSCSITKNGTLVDTLEHDETGIKPNQIGTITVAWNTSGQEPGDYNVSVNVSLAGEHIAAKDLPFKILPSGTLTRAGELKLLYIEGDPLVNHVIKVIASFENTGMIDTMAKFKGEIYCNGEFVDVLEGEEKLIAVGETANLISYYKMTMPGDYLIKGTVIYEGKETEAKDASFAVPEPRAGELKSLSIEGKPEVNRVIKVIACFENTGTVDTKAMFTGEVYCDSEFVDILEGEEKLIAVGETANLISYYKMTMPGDYLIKGTVIYEGKETEAKEVSFTVPD